MKFLLFVGLLAIIWWIWKKRAAAPGRDVPPDFRNPERMVRCSYCGLHLPESDSVVDGDDYFCSHDHQIAARYPDRR